jgi:hypothetical protein
MLKNVMLIIYNVRRLSWSIATPYRMAPLTRPALLYVAVAFETDELYLSSFAAIDGALLISLGAGSVGPTRGKDADFAISICFSVDKRTVSMESSIER